MKKLSKTESDSYKDIIEKEIRGKTIKSSKKKELERTDVRWDMLLCVRDLKKYINELSIWCFFSNEIANSKRRRHLIVDFEGVLLCSSIEVPKERYDFYVQYKAGTELFTHFATLRPIVKEFLESASRWYNVVLYTTTDKQYADALADKIDRKGEIFKKRLYREDCDYLDGRYVKDLCKVSKDMSSVVMLDCSYELYNNKLPIEAFTGCLKDRHLVSSLIILDGLRHCDDVRSILELVYM